MGKKLNEKDYRKHLREQIYFLQSSAQQYDRGHEIEAKRMAIHMRVLLYDTNTDKSLLGQMQLKKKNEVCKHSSKI